MLLRPHFYIIKIFVFQEQKTWKSVEEKSTA